MGGETIFIVALMSGLATLITGERLHRRRKWRKGEKGRSEARRQRARELANDGRHGDAAEMYEAVVASVETELGPNDPQLIEDLVELAVLRVECGRIAIARGDLERAKQIAERASPERESKVVDTAAWVDLRDGQWDRARAHFEHVCAEGSDHERRSLAYEMLAAISAHDEDWSAAERFYRSALELAAGARRTPASQSPYRSLMLPEANQRIFHEPPVAGAASASRIGLLLRIGHAAERQRAFDRAAEAYLTALASSGHDADEDAQRYVRYRLGVLHMQKGDAASAREMFSPIGPALNRASKRWKEFRAFSSYYALALEAHDEHEEALEVVDRAALMDPAPADEEDREQLVALRNMRAWVLCRLDRLEEASLEVEKALTLARFDSAREEDWRKRAIVLDTKAEIARCSKRFEDARELFERILRAFADAEKDSELEAGLVRSNLAKLLADEGREAEAEAERARAAELVAARVGKEHYLYRRVAG